tara:strand:+ start:569 stop:1375 length:807 start_codon:yes stop_codon:yes gene_type:complete
MDPYGEEAPLVEVDDFRRWILFEDEDVLLINKPGWFVCHPSKNGPHSSLVGLVRLYLNADKLHLVARLDRETSGLILFAKRPAIARRYQMAIQDRRVDKAYIAILQGTFEPSLELQAPVGRRPAGSGPVHVKSCVHFDRKSLAAETHFRPLHTANDFTLCRVFPITGRKHQIRVHAAHLGFPVVGDKIYGPDERYYLEFIEQGLSEHLARKLIFPRQALHCNRYRFRFKDGSRTFTAPLQGDLQAFCINKLALSSSELEALLIESTPF